MLYPAFASVLIFAGSLAGQAPDSDPANRPSFTMDITAEHNIIEPGGEVVLKVSVRNASDKVIHLLRVGSGPPQYGFRVFGQNGLPAPLTPMGEAMVKGQLCYKARAGDMRCIVGSSISESPIAPDAKWLDEFLLSYYVDFSQLGQYKIRLERRDPDTDLLVQSNRITLTVAKKGIAKNGS